LIARTLILEKTHHPRPKLCGGGLLPDAETILRQLGLDVTEIPHVNVDWARFDYAGKGFKFRPDPGRLFAFRVIRRHEFDAWLAKKAQERGIEIREGVTVKSVKSTGIGCIVETDSGSFQAQVVVGADGSNSLVRRVIIPHEDLHVARLLEILTEPKPEKSFHRQSDSYFDFVVIPQGIQGYVWEFPAVEKGNPIRVRGIYDSNVLSFKANIPLRFALEEELGRHGLHLSDYKLEGHPLRWFEARSSFSAPRILLVGDAAGADGLFGEGISLALGYGGLAAGAIQEAFTSQDFSFCNYRRTILRSEMGKALQQRNRWAKFFYRLHWPFIQRLTWHHLGPIIVWIMRNFLIGWARRQERKASGRTKL
jgi:flavin-dependent dehydrogenase